MSWFVFSLNVNSAAPSGVAVTASAAVPTTAAARKRFALIDLADILPSRALTLLPVASLGQAPNDETGSIHVTEEVWR